jgi:hypothetical protein
MAEGRDDKGKFTEKNLYAQVYNDNQGRPSLYEDPQDVVEKGVEFFEWCLWARKGKLTSAGLRLWLGMSKTSYHNYSKKPDFMNALSYLETVLEDFNELKLGWAGSTQGAIFWLKNKAGWKDETDQNINQIVTEVKPQIIKDSPPLENKE